MTTPLNYLDWIDTSSDHKVRHDPCRLYLYHFETLDGPVEVLAYTEDHAIRLAEEQGFDVLDYYREVCHG